MRKGRKALKDMKINGSLFLYNPNSSNMVTDKSNCHCADKVMLSTLQPMMPKGALQESNIRDTRGFELNLFFHILRDS